MMRSDGDSRFVFSFTSCRRYGSLALLSEMQHGLQSGAKRRITLHSSQLISNRSENNEDQHQQFASLMFIINGSHT